MLLGSVSIAAIVVGLLSYRSFFTPRRHQLREFSSLSGPARGDTVG
jgi:ABC-type iron transport system FetAB permease component